MAAASSSNWTSRAPTCRLPAVGDDRNPRLAPVPGRALAHTNPIHAPPVRAGPGALVRRRELEIKQIGASARRDGELRHVLETA
jgi:hypothetical protein